MIKQTKLPEEWLSGESETSGQKELVMATEKTKQFMAHLEETPGLVQKVRIQNARNLVRLGSEAGFDFSVEELQQAVRESERSDVELSEEDLEAVAGGGVLKWLRSAL